MKLGDGRGTNLVRKFCGLLDSSEQILGLLSLNIPHLAEVEEAHSRTAPDDPIPVVLFDVSMLRMIASIMRS